MDLKEHIKLFTDDAGYASRKFIFGLATSSFIFIGALIGAKYPTFQSPYITCVGGLLSAFGLYCGINVTQSVLSNKSAVTHAKDVMELASKGGKETPEPVEPTEPKPPEPCQTEDGPRDPEEAC